MYQHPVYDLVNKVLTGQLLDAFDTYYADDVVMQEGSSEPFVGKAINREREIKFLESIKEFHEGAAPAIAAEGDNAFIYWVMEITTTEGQRVRYEQVAHQVWKDGKVVRERFFYDPTTLIKG